MTNATKTLAALFVGLTVLTGLTAWMEGPAASDAFQRSLVTVDTAAVQALAVRTPEAALSVRLARTADAGWAVQRGADGPTYPADAEAVQRALDALGTLRARAVVTRQPEKHARFQVDSTGTIVTALDDEGSALAELTIGRTSFTQRRQPNTYVRPSDAPAVYEVDGLLGTRFNKDVEAWREKRVWTLDRSRIAQVAFKYPADSAFSIERVTTVGGSTWASRGDTLQTAAVGPLLDELARLDATGFVEDQTPDAFGDPLYTLRLGMENGAQRVLRLRPAEDDDNAYWTVASDYPYVFTVRASTWDQRVLNGRSALLRATD